MKTAAEIMNTLREISEDAYKTAAEMAKVACDTRQGHERAGDWARLVRSIDSVVRDYEHMAV